MMDDAFNTSAINDVSKLLPFSFACMMILLAVLVGRFFWDTCHVSSYSFFYYRRYGSRRGCWAIL